MKPSDLPPSRVREYLIAFKVLQIMARTLTEEDIEYLGKLQIHLRKEKK